MSQVSAQIDIAAPIDTVWETIMDPRRLGDWVTIHKSVKNPPPTPLKRGATMEQTMSVRGVNFTVQWTLAQSDAPHQAQWEGTGPAHSKARIRYELSEADGKTRFAYHNEFHPPGGRLGAIAGRFIVGATSEREAKNSLQRLKQLLEK